MTYLPVSELPLCHCPVLLLLQKLIQRVVTLTEQSWVLDVIMHKRRRGKERDEERREKGRTKKGRRWRREGWKVREEEGWRRERVTWLVLLRKEDMMSLPVCLK